MFVVCACNDNNIITKEIDVFPQQPIDEIGVILNQDGDLSFLSRDPLQSEKLLRANVDFIHSIGVKTLTYSVASGSDVMNYPTKVASELGWRKTKYEDTDALWRTRLEKARICLGAGLDAVNIAGTQAKKNNMIFIPSLRMNDSHFMADPYNYPLTGKFWLDNTDLIIKESPIDFDQNYGNLFDYTHEKVREFRYAVIDEVIERNKDIIDGFELDFNRVQVFFPKGKADVGAPLMTDLVRKVRNRLDQLSEEQNRPMYLLVRVPPSEESCKWAGLDIDTWMRENLIDIISPAQLMTLAHDMPIEMMTAKAKKYGVKMYPSLYHRTSYRVPFVPSDVNMGLQGTVIHRNSTNSEVLAAAANYRNIGVDGFYLYNFPIGTLSPEMYPLVASLRNNNNHDGSDRVFAITKTYYNDNLLPSYAYVKQLPAKVSNIGFFNIEVGELPDKSPFPLLKCLLRIGVRDVIFGAPNIRLNETNLQLERMEDHTKYVKKSIPGDAAQKSFIYSISQDLKILKRGSNKVEISIVEGLITDIEIGYSFSNNLSFIFRE